MTRFDSKDLPGTQPLANVHGMIICANSASRLWPLSREHAPLELICEATSGLSPLAKAIRAIRPFCKTPLIIATPSGISRHVKKHIVEHALLDADEYHLLVEPHPRGSALTVALAAATLKLADPHAILLCLPTNIAFARDDRWEQALKRAHQAAENNQIALVGSSVAPFTRTPEERMRAATSAANSQDHTTDKTPPLLGTMRLGPESEDVEGTWRVRSFIARPAPVVAWRAEQSRSLWSTHIFMLKADTALAEMRAAGRAASDPSIQAVQRIAETARFFVSLGSEHWSSKEAGELVATLPAISFEEAVFETTHLLVAVPTSIPFSDLTSFAGYEQSIAADAKGNRLRGKTLAIQTADSTILSDAGKLVVTLGLENAIVIDTADATLVTTKDALASMPSVMAALRSAKAPEL